MEWYHTAISKALADRIKRIYAALGYATPTAFISEAVRLHLRSKEMEFDNIEQEREAGRKVLGTDDKRDEGEL